MRRYIFTLLFCLLVISITGCGKQNQEISQIDYEEIENDYTDEAYTSSDESAGYDSEADYIGASSDYYVDLTSEYGGEDSDTGSGKTANDLDRADQPADDSAQEAALSVPTDDQEMIKIYNGNIVKIHPEAANEGIILMQSYDVWGKNTMVHYIWSIHPDTGEVKLINVFHCLVFAGGDWVDPYGIRYAGVSPFGGNKYTGNRRECFSADFTKMVAQSYSQDNGAQHAGWINNQGIFFDVNEAVGDASKSDFDGIDEFSPAGFTADGSIFVYKSEKTREMYYTEVANPNEVHEGNPLEEEYFCQDNRNNGYTDRINDTQYIRDASGDIEKYDTAASVAEDIISAEGMNCRSGVLSPDGNKMAFLAYSSKGNGETKLYWMPVEGGTPEEIEVRIDEEYRSFFDIGQDGNSNLLEWR